MSYSFHHILLIKGLWAETATNLQLCFKSAPTGGEEYCWGRKQVKGYSQILSLCIWPTWISQSFPSANIVGLFSSTRTQENLKTKNKKTKNTQILKISVRKFLKDKFKLTKGGGDRKWTLKETWILAVLTGVVPHFCEHDGQFYSLAARESFLFFRNSNSKKKKKIPNRERNTSRLYIVTLLI